MIPNKATRVKKEFDELLKNKSSEFIVSQINGDLFHWKAVIKGPPDTVYEGGKFQIDITIPDEYPYQPPKVVSVDKDEVRYQDLASERLLGNWCDLSRHSEEGVEPGPVH